MQSAIKNTSSYLLLLCIDILVLVAYATNTKYIILYSFKMGNDIYEEKQHRLLHHSKCLGLGSRNDWMLPEIERHRML